jgi:CheY-like chemotaxis protein
MPGMGGHELLPLIRERRPDMKILLTSGYNESEARRLCGPCAGTAFIQKPYTAQKLIEKIREMVEPAA